MIVHHFYLKYKDLTINISFHYRILTHTQFLICNQTNQHYQTLIQMNTSKAIIKDQDK